MRVYFTPAIWRFKPISSAGFRVPSHRLTIAIPLHWIWFNSWFTVKKLSRGRKKSETLLAVFGGLPVFEVLIQTSRAVFVFVNSPLEVKAYVLSAGYWMELEKKFL